MVSQLKDIFAATQDSFRQRPAGAAATFTAATRQLAGLKSEATIRDFRLTLDEPPALGGSDSGPNPVEIILAALGTCQEITYRLYADSLGIPLNHVSVKVEGRIDFRGFFAVDEAVRPGFRDIRAVVEIDSPAKTGDIQRLKDAVDRHCPVLDILRNVTPTKLELIHNASGQPVAA